MSLSPGRIQLTSRSTAHSVQSYHFGCLPGVLRKEYIDHQKAVHLAEHNARFPPPPPSTELVLNEETGEWEQPPPPISPEPLPPRERLEWNNKRRLTIPKCWGCKKVGARRCFVCHISGKKVEHCELGASSLFRRPSLTSCLYTGVPEAERNAQKDIDSQSQSQSQPQAAPVPAPAAIIPDPAPQQFIMPEQPMDLDVVAPVPSGLVDGSFNAAPQAEAGPVVPAAAAAPPVDGAAPLVDAKDDSAPGLLFRCTK